MGANYKLHCFGRKEIKRGNHNKLYFFQVIIILLCLCQIVSQTQQSASHLIPLLAFFFFSSSLCTIYTSWIKHALSYISAISRAEMMNCTIQSFSITVSLVVTSLIIFKDNSFNNHLNLNLSIIMIKDDTRSYIHEGTVCFSSLGVVFQILCSCNITLVCSFTKENVTFH